MRNHVSRYALEFSYSLGFSFHDLFEMEVPEHLANCIFRKGNWRGILLSTYVVVAKVTNTSRPKRVDTLSSSRGGIFGLKFLHPIQDSNHPRHASLTCWFRLARNLFSPTAAAPPLLHLDSSRTSNSSVASLEFGAARLLPEFRLRTDRLKRLPSVAAVATPA